MDKCLSLIDLISCVNLTYNYNNFKKLMQVDSKVIGSLFPKYLNLFESEIDRPNDQLEYFIKEQLPDMIKIL
jgi:hypothetical protein